MRAALQDNKFAQVDDNDIDLDFESPNKFFGSHVNLIPLQSAVAGPRLFYGARFMNQAMPLLNREAPLVQAAIDGDEEGKSFDNHFGQHMGAIRSQAEGTIKSVSSDEIELDLGKGKSKKVSLYRDFPLNRKTALTSTSVVKPGDLVKAGQLLAKSNYTDDAGTLALGLNARVGLVPYKGYSMDDSVVISEAFAKRLTQQAMYAHDVDYKRGVKGGKAHYTGLFPQTFVNNQLDKLDDDGVIHVGQKVNYEDPLILATRPKVISSTTSQLGKLSSHMKNARSDATVLWDNEEPGIVTDVKKLRSGVRVNVAVNQPTHVGDKVVFRSGQKGVVSLIIPDEHMPRTATDGKPLEVLLNPLGLPSRVNNSMIYELLLGKAARKNGQPYKVPGFNKNGEKWHDFVEQELAKAKINSVEEIFDPQAHRKLENPVTVGDAYLLKLHHTSSSKVSSRGQGSYDANEQPSHGGGENAQSKRLSGLEAHSLLSSGAYAILKEAATLRGQKNDEFWKSLRAGQMPKAPGVPFAWNKFHAILNGAGYNARKLPDGVERLQFWTDKDLAKVRPIEVKTGDLVDLDNLQPVKGGLFDDALTGANAWGHIPLPTGMPNPAAEDVIRKLLGLTEKEFRSVLAGEMELPTHLLMGKRHADKTKTEKKG